MKIYLKIMLVLFVIMQFIRVDTSNQPIDEKKALHPPKEIEEIFVKACYDCHSDRVRHPWYAQVAPFSWTIANHINQGKKALNFSKWADLSDEEKKRKIDRAIHTVSIGLMPLPTYKLLHKDAVLTKDEIKKLREYFKTLSPVSK